MKFENYMLEAIQTGSVIIPASEKTAFIDYLLRRGARSRFFFCEEAAGLIEVLY